MKSLTVLQKLKLKSVLKLVNQLKTILQQVGITQSNIQAYLFDLIESAFDVDRTCESQKHQLPLIEYLTQLLTQKESTMMAKLKKLQTVLYMEKSVLINGSDPQIVPRKSSETVNQKTKKQKKGKKEKKENQREKEKKKQNENLMNIFKQPSSSSTATTSSTNNQNIIVVQVQKSFKDQPKPETNIFRPVNPLGQSSLMNFTNIFSGIRSEPQPNFFQMNSNNQQADQREDLRRNIRQIQFFKQFVEKQMMMEILGGGNDDIDMGDFASMGSFMFGR